MPKPKIPNQRKAALEHRKRIERYVALIGQLYDKLNKEAAGIAVSTGHDPKKQFMWSDYPETAKAVRELQSRFVSEMTSIVMAGTSAEWRESDLVQDLVAKKVLKAYTGTTKAGEEYTRYFETDPDALKAFQERKSGGMDLSKWVWNLSEQYKTELEMAVSAAIEPGTSAMELAADIKKCLNEPDMMFRRFRYKDEDGNWRRKWKQKVADADGKVHFIDADPKEYHPGRGVYRSSARNAQRLARTEINMAYRTAEQKRWEKFDFVVGYEVKTTQNGKHVADICDDLAGKYPKTFVFKGWHPQCYKDDMDVLTKAGWKRFTDVSDDDLIMSLNPDTREVEWVSVVDRQCYDFDGELVRFYNDNLDCVVTPDHRMPYESTETGQISYCTAERYNYTLGGFINGEKVFFKEYLPYSGKVYDLSLDRNHIMYVRRNGKCFWGSNCMCYCIPILKTEDEFWLLDEGEKSVNEVTDVPKGFKEWIKDNKDRINAAEKRGTLPYFIRYNRKCVENILKKNPEEDEAITNKIGDRTWTLKEMISECTVEKTENGKIYLHPEHGKTEKTENLDFARWRAEHFNEEVILLPNPHGEKSADSYNITRKVQEEYKRCNAPTVNAISQSIRTGKDQSDYLIIEPHEDISVEDLREGITSRVTNGNPPRCPKLKEIRIKIGNFEAVYTREEIIKQGFKIKPEDFHNTAISRSQGLRPVNETGTSTDAKLRKFFGFAK